MVETSEIVKMIIIFTEFKIFLRLSLLFTIIGQLFEETGFNHLFEKISLIHCEQKRTNFLKRFFNKFMAFHY